MKKTRTIPTQNINSLLVPTRAIIKPLTGAYLHRTQQGVPPIRIYSKICKIITFSYVLVAQKNSIAPCALLVWDLKCGLDGFCESQYEAWLKFSALCTGGDIFPSHTYLRPMRWPVSPGFLPFPPSKSWGRLKPG